MPGRAPCRIEKNAVDAGKVRLGGVTVRHGDVGECTEVEGSEGSGDLVAFDGHDLQAKTRQRKRIGAESAAQVGNVPTTGTSKACRVLGRHLQPGGLFQAGLSE